MTTRFARSLARLTIITSLAASLGACDTLASLDPTGLLGGGDSSAPDTNSAAASPDLASLPSAPPTTDDQRDVASSLAATGAQTQYSADALRAGTETSAPPPGAAPSASQLALAAPPSADAPPTSDAAPTANPPTASAPAAAAPPSANGPVAAPTSSAVPTPAASAPAGAMPAIPVSSAPAQPAVAAPIPVNNAPATPAAAPIQTASLPPSSDSAGSSAVTPAGAEPAVPAVPPPGAIHSTIMTPPVMSDAALGFKPSTAPPLDPSVSNFVSQPILARYDRTAALAGVGRVSSENAAVPVNGSTVIASAGDMMGLGGIKPAAVLFFPGDGTTLSIAARAQIRTVVAAFKASGGAATIRVVGHSSSRTADMPIEKHLEVIFEKSHKRALAVLQELVREGVPADHVQVDAVGDSQPVYYESMPKGEEGNRRAEIFLQG